MDRATTSATKMVDVKHIRPKPNLQRRPATATNTMSTGHNGFRPSVYRTQEGYLT